MLPYDQSRMMEQAKFIYSYLGIVLEKQGKSTEDQRTKEIEAL